MVQTRRHEDSGGLRIVFVGLILVLYTSSYHQLDVLLVSLGSSQDELAGSSHDPSL